MHAYALMCITQSREDKKTKKQAVLILMFVGLIKKITIKSKSVGSMFPTKCKNYVSYTL